MSQGPATLHPLFLLKANWKGGGRVPREFRVHIPRPGLEEALGLKEGRLLSLLLVPHRVTHEGKGAVKTKQPESVLRLPSFRLLKVLRGFRSFEYSNGVHSLSG